MDRELLLLGLLRLEKMHAYRLNEFIERDLAVFIDLKRPTAYFLLEKMARQGWITQEEEREGNRPARRIYAITEQGEQEFQRLLRENLGAYSAARFDGDVGLAFADVLDSAEVLTLLAHRRDALAAELDSARAVPPHAGSLQFIIEHRVVHLESELRWLDGVIERIKVARPQLS